MTSVRYGVDLDQLDQAVEVMVGFQRRLEGRLDHLDGEVARLHLIWTGEAARAQHAAHLEWARGAEAMHHALTEMITAARTAHDDYRQAAETNASMWAGLA